MSAPSTPEHPPRRAENQAGEAGKTGVVRRVHTLPSRVIDPTRSPSSASLPVNATAAATAADNVETLFVLDFARVVSFTIAGSTSRPNSSSGLGSRDGNDDLSNGSLPWASTTERTLAAGPLRIYRVPSSNVSFLNSGPLLHPILARSQCWCIDEEAKFVLRVRDGLYYRIELPVGTQQDNEKMDEFKKVLSRVLQYEKTPSPFKRSFLNILEAPRTPVRSTLQPREKAKKWRLNKVWEPADSESRRRAVSMNEADGHVDDHSYPSLDMHLNAPESIPDLVSDLSETKVSPNGISMEDMEANIDLDSDEPKVKLPEEAESFDDDDDDDDDDDGNRPSLPVQPPRPHPRHQQAPRSVTAPPHLTLQFSPPSASFSKSSFSQDVDNSSISSSISSSHDSFYSMEEVIPPLFEDVEPPSVNNHILQQYARMDSIGHSRNSSAETAVPEHPKTILLLVKEPSNPSTPTLLSDWSSTSDQLGSDSAVTPPSTLRHRHHQQQQLSTPSPIVISEPLSVLSPTIQPIFSGGKTISTAIINKTYSLLIGPPAHLIALMLQIAARIVDRLPGQRRDVHRIPCAWDSSEGDEEDEIWASEDGEDDFNMPLGNNGKLPMAPIEPNHTKVGDDGHEENWELD